MSGSGKRKKKVIVYRRPINIGVVFFGFIAVYLIVCVYMFFTSSHITGYEVQVGNLAADYHYTGIALRKEQVYNSEKPGYISYYAREGEKVSLSSTVYTVDESGRMAQAMQEEAEALNLDSADYSRIQGEIASYMGTASDMEFDMVYGFKTSVDAGILDLVNQNLMEQLEGAGGEGNLFTRYPAATSGVVEYYIDGFETAAPEDFSPAWLEQRNYRRKDLRTEELVGQGEPVYKLITDETWHLIFPMDEEMEAYILEKIKRNQVVREDGSISQGKTYIEIRIDKDKEILWPSVTVEYREGQAYGVLEFINSMVRYAGERFLDFEILRDEAAGLKIPKSAVTEKEFYIIDVNYITSSGNEKGFLKQTAAEDGSSAVVLVDSTIYYQDEEFAYVDPQEEDFATSQKLLEAGDLLVKADSAEYYQVGRTEKLQGVYNINKGYTLFRPIQILYENEEYCIVKEGTSYGLSVYDHIVLKSETVKEDEVVY